MRTAEVRYAGPATAEEKRRWDRLLECRDDQQEWVSQVAQWHRRAVKTKQPIEKQQRFAADWKQAVELYDRVNDRLPERYRKRLVNRHHPRILEDHKGGTEK